MQGISVKNIKVRKIKFRSIQPRNIPANELKRIEGIRNIKDRDKGQYALVDGNKIRNFQYFNQIRFFNNLSLRNKGHFITLSRSDQDDPWNNNC